MNSFDARNLRSVRRLNRQLDDPISAWLGAVFASFVRRARPRVPWPHCPPERQDLYGFSADDSAALREPRRNPRARA